MTPVNKEDLELSVGAQTHPGTQRAANEDAILACDPCFLVADGVGGHEFGAQASSAAVEAIREHFSPGFPAHLAEVEEALNKARTAVRSIATTGRGAGSTLTGVIRILHNGAPQWYVLNVGDSRTYLYREHELVQLTRDHSLHAELARAGDPAAEHAPKNVITRALGADDDRYDSWLLPVEPGARIIVCSDGLTNELTNDEIAHVLLSSDSASATAATLLQGALLMGARDNVSVLVVDVSEKPAEPDDLEETGTTIEHNYPRRTP